MSMTRRLQRAVRHAESPLPTLQTPAQAAAAGYNNLIFADDFTSLSTIDTGHSGGAGYNWYLDRLAGWTPAAASDFSVANSVLKIDQSDAAVNCGITTMCSVSGNGYSFDRAYFEARMRFDPSKNAVSSGWPSFWSLSTEGFMNRGLETDMKRWSELDFFEEVPDAYNGSLHDWQHPDLLSSKVDYCNVNTNYKPLPGIDKTKWHTYGCLWESGRVQYYFDNQHILTTNYSDAAVPPEHTNYPVGTFSILDHEPRGVTMILGSGDNWPLEVDWVRVWGKQTSLLTFGDNSPSPRLPWQADFELDVNHLQGSSGAVVSRTTAEHYTGVAALKVVHSADQNSNAWVEIRGVTAGAPISFSARTKGTAGAAPIRCMLHYFDSAGTWLSNASAEVTPDGTWQQMTINSTIAAGTTRVTFAVDKPGNSTATDTVYFDEISIT